MSRDLLTQNVTINDNKFAFVNYELIDLCSARYCLYMYEALTHSGTVVIFHLLMDWVRPIFIRYMDLIYYDSIERSMHGCNQFGSYKS